jgi:hypothetical protein
VNRIVAMNCDLHRKQLCCRSGFNETRFKRCKLVLALLCVQWLVPLQHAHAADILDIEAGGILSEAELAEQRGGLRLPGGLEISIGVRREIRWNDTVLGSVLAAETGLSLLVQNTLDDQHIRITDIVDIELSGISHQVSHLQATRLSSSAAFHTRSRTCRQRACRQSCRISPRSEPR